MKKIYTIMMALVVSASANAQWQQMNGPCTAASNCLLKTGNIIYLGTFGDGIFKSINSGLNWKIQSNGLTNKIINCLAINDSTIYAGTQNGLFQSTINGTNWTPVQLGYQINPNIYSILVDSNNIFVGTASYGVFKSNNKGISWNTVNSGLPYSNFSVSSFTISGNSIFAGTPSYGVYVSNDTGATWLPANTGISNEKIACLLTDGSNIFAGTTSNGVFISSNNGATWSLDTLGIGKKSIRSFTIYNGNIFAGTNNGVYISTNKGASWMPSNSGLTNKQIYALLSDKNTLYLGNDDGVFLSNNNGLKWSKSNDGLSPMYIGSICGDANNLFIGGTGLYKSINKGVSWTIDTIIGAVPVRNIAKNGANIFATTDGLSKGIFVSSNNGISWILDTIGIGSKNISSLLVHNNSIYASTFDGIYKSTNNGANWFKSSKGLLNTGNAKSLAANGNTIFSANNCLELSTDTGNNWMLSSICASANTISLAVTGNKIIAGSYNNGAYVSTDNGITWKHKYNTNLLYAPLNKLATVGNSIVGLTDKNIFLSTDDCDTWTDVGLGLPKTITPSCLYINGADIYLGTNFGLWTRPLSQVVTLNKLCSASFTLQPDATTPHHWYAINLCSGLGTLIYSWNWGDGSANSTGANPSHTFTAPGYYKICVTITDSVGCTSTYCDNSTYISKSSENGAMISLDVVNQIPSIITGISNTSTSKEISIYPNPATTNVTISGLSQTNQTINISNIVGEMVQTESTNGASNKELNVSNLPSGLYFISVGGRSVKFVKE